MTKVVLPNVKPTAPKWDESTNWGESTWADQKPRELTEADLPATSSTTEKEE
jgi:hypothetical protein